MKNVIIPAAALGLTALAGLAVHRDAMANQDSLAAWHLVHEGEIAKLTYGVADTDQLALMLTCSPGDHDAVLYGDTQPDSPALTPMASGPQPIDPLSDGQAFEARLPLGDQTLASLANNGRIRVRSNDGSRTLRASPAERRLIQRFLGYCEYSLA